MEQKRRRHSFARHPVKTKVFKHNVHYHILVTGEKQTFKKRENRFKSFGVHFYTPEFNIVDYNILIKILYL